MIRSHHDVKKGLSQRSNFVAMWLLKILYCFMQGVKSCCQFLGHQLNHLWTSVFVETTLGLEVWDKLFALLLLVHIVCCTQNS